MFTHKTLRVALIAAVMLLALNASPGSAEKLSVQPLPAPAVDPDEMGAAFTYQGRLLSGSSPATGVYDFKFSLYDDSGSSSETLLRVIEVGDLTVTNGLFMTDLDFGARYFKGFERWLEIGVRPGTSTGSYTTLSPRQQINPAPYATFAGTIYRNTVVVKPVTPSGSELMNGQILIDTLGNISDASASNRYLLKIEPGIYDIDMGTLNLIEYVDIEGSGEGVTIITGDGSDNPQVGTVTAKYNSEIRSLTIESTGINSNLDQFNYATAVYIPAGITLKLLHVSLIASNGFVATRGICNDGEINDQGTPDPSDDTFTAAIADLDSVSIDAYFNGSWGPTDTPRVEGIYNDDISYVRMNDSTVTAIGGAEAFGLDNMRGSANIESSDIAIKGENFNTYSGIRNYLPESSLTMRNSTINVSGESAGTAYLNGIENNDAGIVQLFDTTVTASGVGVHAVGILGGGEAPALLALNNVKVDVFGNNKYNYGIYYGDAPVVIRDSYIYAHDGGKAIGLYFQDSGAPDHTITQTEIKVEGAALSLSSDPKQNGNIGVYIWSDGNFKFIRDSIWVQDQDSETIPVGGVGIVNDGGQVIFENGNIGSTDQLTFIGIAHYVYATPAWNTLYVNNSEIYSCGDPFSSCTTVITLPGPVGGNLPQTPVAFIGSTLLWGNSVSPGMPVEQCAWVHDDAWGLFPGPACP